MIEWFPSQAEISSSDGESSASDALTDTEVVDAFPSMIFDDLCDARQILALSTSMEYMKSRKVDVIPVIPFLKDYSYENDNTKFYQRVVFYNLIQDRNLLFDRFDRLYDGAGVRLPRTGYEDIDWSSLENKLTKDPRLTHRYFRTKTNKTDGLNRKGNVDNRQSFVYRNHHLVKTHLTNGVRTTHVYDLYIIFNVPILIYRQIAGPSNPEGSFYANTRRFFEPYLLDSTASSYTIYAVRPKTTYLTLSLQKTCYAIVRVTERVFAELQKEYSFFDAFDPNFFFRPKSQEELDRITRANCIKRKRGRPAKSLDKMYWYKESCPSPPPPPPPQTQSYYLVAKENSNTQPTTPVATTSQVEIEHIEVKVDPALFDDEAGPSKRACHEKTEDIKNSETDQNEAQTFLDQFLEQELEWIVSSSDSMPVL